MREKYINKDIVVKYVCNQEQLADILTKPLNRDIFKILSVKNGMMQGV